ncbi:MAG TPA: NTP transferase domain-containing protein [Acidothermaceae bacterium]
MPFDAVVVAGGAGQRMGDPRGTDKAGLDVGGVTLLDRVLSAVADAHHCIVVGPRRPTAWPVTFTVEEPAGSGPAAAIVHGLSFVDAATVVVLAADMPFAATAVPKLIDALAGAHADAAMLVDDAGRRQPLLAAYRTDALRRCSDGRDWRGASVRALTEGLTVVEVAAVGDEALDCDTPEQLTAAQEAATLPPTG